MTDHIESPAEHLRNAMHILRGAFAMKRGARILSLDEYHALTRRLDAALAGLDAENTDAARYRWLRPRLHGADFSYGDPPESVIVFGWPRTARISANLDVSIDDARADRAAALTTTAPVGARGE